MVSGLFVAAGGSLLIMLTAHDAGPLILIIGASLLAFGAGPTLTIASEQIISSVPQERAGSASAMNDVSSGLGYALSIAFIGSLGMYVYRQSLANSIPAGVPSEIVNSAMESIGAAVVAAEGVPKMLQAVQSSFTVAIQTIYGLAAIGLFVLMTIIIWKLRHVRQEDTVPAEKVTVALKRETLTKEFQRYN